MPRARSVDPVLSYYCDCFSRQETERSGLSGKLNWPSYYYDPMQRRHQHHAQNWMTLYLAYCSFSSCFLRSGVIAPWQACKRRCRSLLDSDQRRERRRMKRTVPWCFVFLSFRVMDDLTFTQEKKNETQQINEKYDWKAMNTLLAQIHNSPRQIILCSMYSTCSRPIMRLGLPRLNGLGWPFTVDYWKNQQSEHGLKNGDPTKSCIVICVWMANRCSKIVTIPFILREGRITSPIDSQSRCVVRCFIRRSKSERLTTTTQQLITVLEGCAEDFRLSSGYLLHIAVLE